MPWNKIGVEVTMPATVVNRDDTYVLNHCTRSLARDNSDERHNYGQYGAGDARGAIAEVWRFPIVDSFFDALTSGVQAYNLVTFVIVNRDGKLGDDIAVIGTFSDLITPIRLNRIGETDY